MAGKGDKPRNCFSKKFKENFDKINWKKQNKTSISKSTKLIKGKLRITY
jgi:hypothetical protein